MLIASRVLPSVPGHTYSLLSRSVVALVVGWGMAVHGISAHASQEAVDEVAKLLEQGKAAQAAKQAESYLKQNPGDVQMRFMQGVIAAEQKQNAQAIKVFSALTRDYPNLPEPYNNLAVLYAAEGQERKASEVLEQAIRTNPSYATAHENLGDLYARMASEAYSKALQLDSGRQAIQPKLALITQIFPKQGGQAKAVVAQAAPAQPLAASAKAPEAKGALATSTEVKQVASATAKQADTKPAVKVAAETKPAAAAPLADTRAAEAKAVKVAVVEDGSRASAKGEASVKSPDTKVTEEKPKQAQAAVAAAVEKPAQAEKKAAEASAKSPAAAEVESAVKDWAAAWAAQDMNRYLDAYSEKFTPADGSSLTKWKETRRLRIVGKSSISVSLRDLKVSVDGDKATAQFRQYYAAGALKSTTRKTLRLQREKGHWRITHEGTGA